MDPNIRQFVEKHPDLRAVVKSLGILRSDRVSPRNSVVGSCINSFDRDTQTNNAVVGSRFRVKINEREGDREGDRS